MAVTDGISQILLDFDIVGEKGKKGNYGMSTKEINRRHKTEHKSKILQKREIAYDISKIELAKDMIKRAIERGVKFQYLLHPNVENEALVRSQLGVDKELLGFKYWIIKDNPSLMESFSNDIRWNKVS